MDSRNSPASHLASIPSPATPGSRMCVLVSCCLERQIVQALGGGRLADLHPEMDVLVAVVCQHFTKLRAATRYASATHHTRRRHHTTNATPPPPHPPPPWKSSCRPCGCAWYDRSILSRPAHPCLPPPDHAAGRRTRRSAAADTPARRGGPAARRLRGGAGGGH